MTILANANLSQRNELSSVQGGIGIMPTGLVLDGTTDNTSAIANAFAVSRSVRLPAGAIKITNLTIPTGCSLLGAGPQVWDRSSAWVGTGTLLVGTVIVTGSTDVLIQDLSIDAFATGVDAIDGKSDATRRITVRRVHTRANNHGHLYEKNLTGDAPNDRIGAAVNQILVEDCVHNGGPNGFVSKMRGVTFRRCIAYDVTNQAFVAVSDCINSANTFSRGRDVLFDGCDAIGCANTLHVYSRDNFSTNNANGVLPADNIRWTGGRIGGALSSQGAHIGDPASLDATLTRIASTNVWIKDALIEDNNQNGILWQNVDGGGYDGCVFRNNGTAGGGVANSGVLVDATKASNVRHGLSNVLSGTAAGYETLTKSVQTGRAISSAEKGITFLNFGAGGAVALTLPTPTIGDEYSFEVTSAQTLSVASAAPTTNFIYDQGSAVANNISSNQRGARLTLKAMQSTTSTLFWYVIVKYGTWTAA